MGEVMAAVASQSTVAEEAENTIPASGLPVKVDPGSSHLSLPAACSVPPSCSPLWYRCHLSAIAFLVWPLSAAGAQPRALPLLQAAERAIARNA
jgi:hypothetical protein